MSCPCIILSGAIIHRSEVVILIADRMRRNSMRHLCGCIRIQFRIAGCHSAKQCDINRRIFLKRLLTFLRIILHIRMCNGDMGQCFCLCAADKEQSLCFRTLVSFFGIFLKFQFCRFQHLPSHLRSIGRGIFLCNILCHEINKLFRPLSDLFLRKQFQKFSPHRMLPGLTGNTGTKSSSINCCLRLPDHTAWRNCLQYMKIYIHSVLHKDAPFSSALWLSTL